MWRKLIIAAALLSLTGCAAGGQIGRSLFSSGGSPEMPISARAIINPNGVTMDINLHAWAWQANMNGPELQWQDQFGGWHSISDRSGVDIPGPSGGMNFNVIPNGFLAWINATYDGNCVGNGMHFGVPNMHDNGTHRLKVQVACTYSTWHGTAVVDTTIITPFQIAVGNQNGY